VARTSKNGIAAEENAADAETDNPSPEQLMDSSDPRGSQRPPSIVLYAPAAAEVWA